MPFWQLINTWRLKDKKEENSPIDLYKNRSTLKWVILVFASLISIASVFYTNFLVNKIKDREKKLISLYASTLEFVANEPDNTSIYFLFEEIIVANNSIPVIITDELGNPFEFKNIPKAAKAKTEKVKKRILRKELKNMAKEHEPLLITFRNDINEITGYQYIYYKNSFLLTQLKYYPFAQLSVIGIFGFIAFMAFSFSKTAEQNRVWVGLAKETAHQLGTPLSSLMAWIEYFKTDEDFKNKEIIDELSKDVSRLEMITARFSNIGSEPVLTDHNLYEVIVETMDYLKKRISTKVSVSISYFPDKNITANINKPLFEWVIENICKNAVDAMKGTGSITIKILQANEGKAVIDITDTGKGMTKAKAKQVFNPGFTTKQRGWGLGLTLVKRIVENYHRGKIFVKKSDPNQGTTFRISFNSTRKTNI